MTGFAFRIAPCGSQWILIHFVKIDDWPAFWAHAMTDTDPAVSQRANALLPEAPQLGWRLPAAIALFILAIASLLAGVTILASGASASIKSVAGILVFPAPEILDVTAIAILGKPGFEWFKAKVFGFLRRHGPPDKVSRTRYRAGLVLFALPLIVGWFGPYFAHLIPAYDDNRIVWQLGFDLIFVASFFVLGGDFWDKVRALFDHGTKVMS